MGPSLNEPRLNRYDAELFRAEKAREHLLKVAADYESMPWAQAA
jgi:hypothetical protein